MRFGSKINIFIGTVIYSCILQQNQAIADLLEISTVSQLTAISTDLDNDYVLTQSLSVSELTPGQTYISGNFTGNFNGAGFTISGLTAPLFDTLGGDGSTLIENLSLQSAASGIIGNGILANTVSLNTNVDNVSGSGIVTGIGIVGGLVGNSAGDFSNSNFQGSVSTETQNLDGNFTAAGGLIGSSAGSVLNSHSSGEVNGDTGDSFGTYAGGLIGYSQGAVLNSSSSSTVNGYGISGGLIGSTSSTVGNSFATGNVLNNSNPAIDQISTGGLVGNTTANISDSYSTADVSGPAEKLGGLVGMTTGQIQNSHATGNVSGTGSGWDVGGLVGFTSGLISNSYSTGAVSGWRYVGGLAGISGGNIENSYSSVRGDISGVDSSVGGLVGQMNGNISNSYAIVVGNISGTYSVGGLVGNLDSANLNNSYIFLTGNILGIGSVGGLVGAVNREIGIFPEVRNSFVHIDGNISGTENIGGLVGTSYAQIDNSFVYVTGSIFGTEDRIGGLVGVMNPDSVIENSQVTVGLNIYGRDKIGGIAGESYSNIENTSASIGLDLYGTDKVGGIVGLTESEIIDSKVVINGLIAGSEYVGGIAGYSQGDILNTDATIKKDIVGPINSGGIVGRIDNGIISNSDVLLGLTSSLNGLVAGYSIAGQVVDSFVSMDEIVSNGSTFNLIGSINGGTILNFSNPSLRGFDISELPNFPSIIQVVNSGVGPTYFAINTCFNSNKPYLISLTSSYVNSCTNQPYRFNPNVILIPSKLSELKLTRGFDFLNLINLPNSVNSIEKVNSDQLIYEVETNLDGNKKIFIGLKDILQISFKYQPNKRVQAWINTEELGDKYLGNLDFDESGSVIFPALNFSQPGTFIIKLVDVGEASNTATIEGNELASLEIFVRN